MISDPDYWSSDDGLVLIEGWARDGYTLKDIANRIGVSYQQFCRWRKKYPELDKALKSGREIVDYKVENALLKSALGYQTREVKITTVMRKGHVVETVKETTDKEQAPNVYAIQCWLFNRLPDKWKRNRDNIIDLDGKDESIQVTVVRASNDETGQKESKSTLDENINRSVEIRPKTEQEIQEEKARAKAASEQRDTKVVFDDDDAGDLDYWPDDWEDE